MNALPNDPAHFLNRSRVVAEFETACLQLHKAQAATDRLCVNNSVQSVVMNCERDKVLRAISTASSIYEYYAKLSAHLHQQLSQHEI